MARRSEVTAQVREARREAYREAILDAAIGLFAERGFSSIKMSEIAKAAGVAKGTLYNYFDDKEEVFAALAERGRQHFLDGMDAAMASVQGWARLEAQIRHMLGFLAQNRALVRIYLEATGLDPRSKADPGRLDGELAVRKRMSDCLSDLVAAGEIRSDLPLDLLVTLLSGSIEACAKAGFDCCGAKPLEVRAELLIEVFRKGVVP